MSSAPDKCQTCNSYDKTVGNYCGRCTADLVARKMGWSKQSWWGGGARRKEPRASKREALGRIISAYALGGYGEPDGSLAAREEAINILVKYPTIITREDTEVIDEIFSIVDRRIRGNKKAGGKDEQRGVEKDYQ